MFFFSLTRVTPPSDLKEMFEERFHTSKSLHQQIQSNQKVILLTTSTKIHLDLHMTGGSRIPTSP